MERVNIKLDKNLNSSQVRSNRISEMKADSHFMQHLASLEIDDALFMNNIAVLYQYRLGLESVKTCEKAGQCVQDDFYHHYNLEVVRDNIFLKIAACPYFVKFQQEKLRYKFQDFPIEYNTASLANLTRRTAQNEYVGALLSLIKGSKNSIFVSGPPGVGKLYLAVATLNHLIDKDENIVVGVIDFPAIIRQLGTNYFEKKAEAEQTLNQLIDLDYLILDKFGNEETNKLMREAIVLPLVSERNRLQKPTIYLSELTLDEIASIYDVTKRDVRAKQIINAIKNSVNAEIFISGTKL